jgi:hypothetical protein
VSPADPYHLVKQLQRRGWEAGVAHREGKEEERVLGGVVWRMMPWGSE